VVNKLDKKIIPCLDVAMSENEGVVVKGVRFDNLRGVGDPVDLAKRYSKEGADELVFLDIMASVEGRDIITRLVENVSENINIPFTVGGGIKDIEDISKTLDAGADKIGINTAAVENPSIIKQGSKEFGSECIVSAVDVKRRTDNKGSNRYRFDEKKSGWFEVVTMAGKKSTGIDAIEWVKKVEKLGAGGILLTSKDKDGTKNGYDNVLNKAVTDEIDIPVIASGGAGSPKHMFEAFVEGNVNACLAASIFHFDEYDIDEVKNYLRKNGISI